VQFLRHQMLFCLDIHDRELLPHSEAHRTMRYM
jgi:hypothetical protein